MDYCCEFRWNLSSNSVLAFSYLSPFTFSKRAPCFGERHLSSLCLVAFMPAVFKANGENELTRSFLKVAMMNVAMTHL